MKILDEMISTLDMKAGVRDIRQGLFHTAVLTRNCGLAATLPRDALQQEQVAKWESEALASNISDIPGKPRGI